MLCAHYQCFMSASENFKLPHSPIFCETPQESPIQNLIKKWTIEYFCDILSDSLIRVLVFQTETERENANGQELFEFNSHPFSWLMIMCYQFSLCSLVLSKHFWI